MDLVSVLIYLLIIAIVFTLVLFIVNKAPIAEPFKGVIVWIVYVIGALFLIAFLLQLAGLHSSFAPIRLR